LNPQRPEPQSGALPIELHPPQSNSLYLFNDFNGTPEGIRTPDPQLRRLMLYPTELLAQELFMVAAQGFEPRTCGL
jgi:hypothetical protein